ncbi:threonine/homoserine/homoserine lactone efflux protein [Methanohalophilus levihalophilus]|uniref:LysE family translocator n=1 Tax=Methanohalophilus levihalophilus TaxID=1431282 RepID=UPI001AE88E74|nr:LysE family transporter [Methanohalophilus levihalophilus]MBP2029148.1 threonine/homoserine/homoserine lactone efflux protein [Methanohalophilus levihalophilus]
MFESAEFLLMGLVLGFAAGISPGPLMAMTISETLQHGSKEGIKVAISPLITDILIVSSIVLLLIHFENQESAIALISLTGALYLVHLGISSLRTQNIDIEISNGKKDSLKKGILANFLSPHPYLFWIAIGGPIFFRALEVNILAVVLFIFGFYLLLVGSKIVLALAIGKFSFFLKNKYYLYTIRSLGVVYLIFAMFFITQGLGLLGLNIAAL